MGDAPVAPLRGALEPAGKVPGFGNTQKFPRMEIGAADRAVPIEGEDSRPQAVV